MSVVCKFVIFINICKKRNKYEGSYHLQAQQPALAAAVKIIVIKVSHPKKPQSEYK